ncbi:hypothetical protein [Kitasatospora sp. NPDC057223]|uniref:hypothetical protein n=1 Tax=Kitasatospora sp. NPDC057223 TaxID=3346055 RepID=UPI003631D587
MDIDEVADQLNAPAPADFTKARDAAAGRARQAGDRDLTRRIKRLRKPTTAAWMANQLTRNHHDQITAFTGLGHSLRRAQHDLAGAQLRDLLVQRREVVAALVDQAREDARAAGHQVGSGPEEELAETLQAALADEQAARGLALGRLTTALHPGSSPALPAPPDASPHRAQAPAPAATPQRAAPERKSSRATARRAEQREELRRDAERLRGEAEAAEEAARDAEERAGDLGSRAEQADHDTALAEAAVEDARAALAAAEGHLEDARAAARDAHELAGAGARTVGQARAHVAGLTAQIAKLNSRIAECTE